MMRVAPLARDFYIPKGSVKLSDKASDALVYVYTSAKDRLAAMAFHGKAVKPDWHHTFANDAARERKIREHFEARRRWCEWKQERRDERKKPHGFEVGHILYASWGYEQTNIDFYQVTKIIGRHMVEVREVSQVAADTGNEPWMTGKVVPKLDAFTGESMPPPRQWPLQIRAHRQGANRIPLGRTPGQLDRLRLTPSPPPDISNQHQHEDHSHERYRYARNRR